MNTLVTGFRWGVLLAAVLFVVPAGCGVFTIMRSVFPNQAVDDDGEALTLDDLQEVTADTTSTPDQMIRDLLSLGLDDEELLQAIVDNGLPEDLTRGGGSGPDVGDLDGDGDDGTDGGDGDGTSGDGT